MKSGIVWVSRLLLVKCLRWVGGEGLVGEVVIKRTKCSLVCLFVFEDESEAAVLLFEL